MIFSLDGASIRVSQSGTRYEFGIFLFEFYNFAKGSSGIVIVISVMLFGEVIFNWQNPIHGFYTLFRFILGDFRQGFTDQDVR